MSENLLSPAAARVLAASQALGLSIAVREMPASTRTAQEAAVACGCSVGQIVKSLIFVGRQSGRDHLLLVSGSNRVDEEGVSQTIGEALTRPDADHVRRVTGFAIGGIPPFGHTSPLTTYMDEDLLAYAVVWAAAGTPRAVFSVDPGALARALGAALVKIA